jgi:transcription elongation GreA/GreB family factor
MSRAFTREADNEVPPQIPERPVSRAPNLVTPRGAALIEDALQKIEQALADTNDEALQRDRRYWLVRHATMKVVAPARAPDKVGFGTRVTIERGGKVIDLQIVGEDEADPAHGLISWTAPLARALDGAAAGDTVDFALGQRTEPIKVIAIAGEQG